jgi:hypothetical protein
MPRKPQVSEPRIPSYRLHKASGQAVVTLNRREHYVGPHGTPESRERYEQLIAQWLAGGRQLPDAKPADGLSVAEVLQRYVQHADAKYGARRDAVKTTNRVKMAVRGVRELYGLEPAARFGPKALLTVREKWIRDGLGRTTINANVKFAKRAFKWAVREELVPPSLWHGLSAVEGLRRGDSTAPEPRRSARYPRRTSRRRCRSCRRRSPRWSSSSC